MSDNKDFWNEGDGLRIERVDRDGHLSGERAAPGPKPDVPPPAAPSERPAPEPVRIYRPEEPKHSAPPARRPQPPAPKPVQKPKDEQQDFRVDFDFDEEYESPDERAARERAVKPRREKRTGCLGGVMFFLFVVCAAVIIASVGWIAAMDVLGLGGDDVVVEVEIPREFTIGEVTSLLYENGLIKYKPLFKFYADFSHADEKIKGGTYQLNMNYDYRALVYGMTPSGGTKVEAEPITIPEGYTLRQIFTLLDANSICFEEDLWDAAANYNFEYDFLDESTLGDENRLEGFLFPDTYKFYVNDTPSRVINKFLKNFNNKFTDKYRERAAELGYTVNEIVTVASMIEKEAAGDSERATIASVIYNRLNTDTTGKLLQIDATIYYAIAGTDKKFSTELDDPYNTYKYAGLTPGPIANPGVASIKAALYPEDTGYYYYALGTDNVHHFFKNYDPFTDFLNSDAYKRS